MEQLSPSSSFAGIPLSLHCTICLVTANKLCGRVFLFLFGLLICDLVQLLVATSLLMHCLVFFIPREFLMILDGEVISASGLLSNESLLETPRS